ncbi:DUF3551 domain-containing protein [Tardiphaga sp.]|uniref:DUF3551 domain-containing protein n=1 Tax=Tardiphaga sp. TaxID=1926292 RepID=UPI00262A41F9|nr:DUF3551 domain-containing protein [Tardiphaga sp.]MDB5620055.1 hypothetical protein [Tardiphaga sp.]
MRSLLAATALLVVTGAATPSMARDYPVCARLVTNDFNPSCSFDTMRQCMATVSGIGGDCIQNPAFAYNQMPRPRRGKAVRTAPQNDWDNGGWDWNRRW